MWRVGVEGWGKVESANGEGDGEGGWRGRVGRAGGEGGWSGRVGRDGRQAGRAAHKGVGVLQVPRSCRNQSSHGIVRAAEQSTQAYSNFQQPNLGEGLRPSVGSGMELQPPQATTQHPEVYPLPTPPQSLCEIPHSAQQAHLLEQAQRLIGLGASAQRVAVSGRAVQDGGGCLDGVLEPTSVGGGAARQRQTGSCTAMCMSGTWCA